MKMLTKNFSEEEMRCRCKECDGGRMDLAFMTLLQEARSGYGRPVYVTSGFRCEKHNREVGGLPHSLHLFGMAADAEFFHIQDVYNYVRSAMNAGLKKIGIKRLAAGHYMVHVDASKEPGIFVYE